MHHNGTTAAGLGDDDDSDTMDEEVIESDIEEIGGSDDDGGADDGDDGSVKPNIIPLVIVDIESECIVCMNDKIEMKFEPCNHEICCAACSDKLDFCPMCRAQIREVPKNTPEPEEETIDLLDLLSRGIIGPAHGEPRDGGQIMARLSLGQLLIGLASAQEEGNRRQHAASGPPGVLAAGARHEQMQAQRRLLLELGSLMLSRVNAGGGGGGGGGDDGSPADGPGGHFHRHLMALGGGSDEALATPNGEWACGRCTLINDETDVRCVACYAHYSLSEEMHTQNGTSNQQGITAGGD